MKLTAILNGLVTFPGFRAMLLSAPRVLVPLGTIAASVTCLNACVSRLAYEEAASAAEVEREGHRRAELELVSAKARVAELSEQLKTRSEGADVREQKLAEEKYERNVVTKERDETASLLSQLRGELARANEHLEVYARKNARLEHELSVSRDGGQGSALLRDVQALLSAQHLDQSVRVTENAQGVVLSIPSDLMFKKGDAELSPTLGTLSTALSRFGESHPELNVVLREGAADPALPESIGKQRRDSLRALLSHPKWGERFRFEAGNGPAPASYELSLGFASARP